jgi:hypothetical protein
MSRDGKDKFAAEVVGAASSATANSAGVMATASPGSGGHQVALYDSSFRFRSGIADFEEYHNPVHVEAGASGDFYGLDTHRVQIVRVTAAGKQVKSYSLPDSLLKKYTRKPTYWDCRVCEKTEAFYLLTQPDPVARIVCVGFNGKVRWTYEGRIHFGMVGVHRWVGAFDVDDKGVLHVLDEEVVKKLDPDGNPVGELKLRMGDAKPGPRSPGYGYLRVHAGDVLLRRGHDSELFQRYDLKTGELKQVVSTDHERLTVRVDGDVWTAGQPEPVQIKLTAGDRALAPRWRVWARPLASLDYREFPLKDGAIQVPRDAAGLYLVKFTPEVRPWQCLAPSGYIVRTVVEVRQSGTKGSATVFTPENRTHYGRGEEIPLAVHLRGLQAEEGVKLTVRLLDGTRTIAQAEAETKGSDEVLPFEVHKSLTAALKPGRYTLAVSAAGLSGTSQPLFIGRGLNQTPFHIVQHGDYGQLYPSGDVWDTPDLVAAHAARTAKLGVNLMVDRLGWEIDLHNHLAWNNENRNELDALFKRLGGASGGVSPKKSSIAPPLLQTQAAYGAAGIQQMASLVGMDAGLPLGKPHDQRKREGFQRDIVRVTEALKPYPSFRGWMWSANWWTWEEGYVPGLPRRHPDAKSAEEKAAYLAAFQRAEKTGDWDAVLDKVGNYRLDYAVDAQEFFNTTLRKIAPGKVTSVAGPYRRFDHYPPVNFANVDEVCLHYQAEQLQWPNIAPHNVDYQKRPGKRAWGHPELFNDAGTGDQILPAYFQMVMRGADGVGCSGPIPGFGPQPVAADPRSSYHGTTSVFRAANNLLRQYGPWLATLRGNDRVAIVVSGRMCRIDDWGGIGGRYFDRLFEAYQSCLHAHYPASFVFVEDLRPDTFAGYKAALVIGQTVELEPELIRALKRAKAAGTVVLHDETCRKELVAEYTSLGIAFNKIGNDPSVWQDDTAYLRFPGYYRAHLPALTKALGAALPPVAEVDNPEVLLSERGAEEGRYLFLVNNTAGNSGV